MIRKRDYADIITDVANGSGGVNGVMYGSWARHLRRGVELVYHEKDAADHISARLHLNASRFAAYKAHRVTALLADAYARRVSDDSFRRRATVILDGANERQRTEYNTTVTRARTAKDWEKFGDRTRRRLFPNLRWLPSLSVHQREQHIPYYNKVWSKDDPFWQANQPGSLWNCKCRWEETADGVDGVAPDVKPAPGLGGNPAVTGEIFTRDHPYFEAARRQDVIAALAGLPGKGYYDVKLPNGTVQVSPFQEYAEIARNLDTCNTLLKHRPKAELKLLPYITDERDLDIKEKFYGKDYVGKYRTKCADALYDGKIVEFEEPLGTRKSVQRAVRNGVKQSNTLILRIPDDADLAITRQAIADEIADLTKRSKNKRFLKGLKVYIINKKEYQEYVNE